jgi:hypothetical protein
MSPLSRTIAAVLLLGSIVVGCSQVPVVGSVAPSATSPAPSAADLDGYYAQMGPLITDFRSSNRAAFETLNKSQDLAELKEAFASLPVSLSGFLVSARAIAVPDDVAGVHADAIESGQAFLALLQDVNSAVQAATDVDGFVAVAGNDELEGLRRAFNDQCPRLQAIANDKGLEIDLGCT